MTIQFRHLRHQLPVIASMGQTALSALLPSRRDVGGVGTKLTRSIPPIASALIRDYVREVGGDPKSYQGTVPSHLFPHWGFALAARTLRGIPYPLSRVMNAGCRLEIHAPLPAREALNVTAEWVDIDDNGQRAIVHQVVTTGTTSVPRAVTADLFVLVPLAGKQKSGSRKPRARVPDTAREVARFRLGTNAGLAFAMLTGDFNPVHWVRPYARAVGFANPILHGYATMARAYEGLIRHVYSGDASAISAVDVKFTRPLVLPADIGLYVEGDSLCIGTAPGGPAFMTGTFRPSPQRSE